MNNKKAFRSNETPKPAKTGIFTDESSIIHKLNKDMNFFKIYFKHSKKGVLLAGIILIFLLIPVMVQSQNLETKKINLNVNDVTLENALAEIESQSKVTIFFGEDLDKYASTKVSIAANNISVNDAISRTLSKTNLTYILQKNQVMIKEKTAQTPHVSLTFRKYTGTVTDESGETLIGANISIKDSPGGTITDIDGRFSIEAPLDATLLVSYIGYVSREIKLDENTSLEIVLSEDQQSLDEVVVVGYGTARRRDITGATASVNSELLMKRAPTSIEQALQGQVAGVLIAQGNGFDSSPSIRVRGNRSIGANNDPLFVVDGIPIWGDMTNINPADIQSVEVLKDASSTAIYGVRGANGVILVTTKKGEEGRVQVEYQGDMGISTFSNRFREVYDAAEYIEYVRESNRQYTYDGLGGYTVSDASVYKSESASYDDDMGVLYFTNDPSGYVLQSLKMGWGNNNTVYDPSKVRGYDWQKATYRDVSITQNHSVNVRAGSQNTKLMISGSYLNQKGMNLDSDRTRYTLRLNLDQVISKFASVGANINFSHTNMYGGPNLSIASDYSPLASPYYSPGGGGQNGLGGDVTQTGDPALGMIPYPAGEFRTANPFLNIDGTKGMNKYSRISNVIYAQLNLLEGLTYRINFGMDLGVRQGQTWASHISSTTNYADPRASQEFDFDRDWTIENILTYKKTLFDDHSFDVTFVQSAQERMGEPASISVVGLIFEPSKWYDLGNSSTKDVSSGFTKESLLSWMGRINYSMKGKYMLTGTVRWDGASQLAKGNKWATFPAVSLGWRISEEEFMKDFSLIHNLKLRAGYGVTGQSSVNPYATIGSTISSRYTWGKDSPFFGQAPSTLSSPFLGWEYTAQYNVGIDLSLLGGRLSSAIDLYKQNTTDLLMPRALPMVTGFAEIMENIGETQNQGIEIGIQSVNIQTNKFNWTTNLQFAANKEEIVRLDFTNSDMNISNGWFVGKPIDTYYDYVAAPVVWGYSKEDMEAIARFRENNTNFEPGDLRLVDLDGDYKITDEDRSFRGQRMPKWTASMANTFQIGSFDLYTFMYSMVGQTVNWNPNVRIDGRYNTYNVDYWTPRNTDTRWLKPRQGMQAPANYSAMNYWKGSFLKISDITLGYTLPKKLTQKAGMDNARIYVKVQDPFLFTEFEGPDPEASVAGVDVNSNPMVTYRVGLNVTF